MDEEGLTWESCSLASSRGLWFSTTILCFKKPWQRGLGCLRADSQTPCSQRLSISPESEGQGRRMLHWGIGSLITLLANNWLFVPFLQAPYATDVAETWHTWDEAILGIQTTDPILFLEKHEGCIWSLVQRIPQNHWWVVSDKSSAPWFHF